MSQQSRQSTPGTTQEKMYSSIYLQTQISRCRWGTLPWPEPLRCLKMPRLLLTRSPRPRDVASGAGFAAFFGDTAAAFTFGAAAAGFPGRNNATVDCHTVGVSNWSAGLPRLPREAAVATDVETQPQMRSLQIIYRCQLLSIQHSVSKSFFRKFGIIFPLPCFDYQKVTRKR